MTDVICDLPIDDRPRERLLAHGAGTLSDAELVAILIGSGTPGQNAIQLARELLRGGIQALSLREARQLATIRGIGYAKATRIAAAFEFSRRFQNERPEELQPYDENAVGRLLIGLYGAKAQEHVGAFFLDSRRRMLHRSDIFIGTTKNALVSAREIVKYALRENAVGVVLFHNHPSGDPAPSAEDVAFTQKVNESLKLVDLELHDHLIIGLHAYYTMQNAGYI